MRNYARNYVISPPMNGLRGNSKGEHWMFRQFVLAAIATLSIASISTGQSIFAQPYDAQLRTDPAVGNIQGIQRYGRPLKTDPDQGEGYSYHVYPVAHSSPGNGSPAADPSGRLAIVELASKLETLSNELRDTNGQLSNASEADASQLRSSIAAKLNQIESIKLQLAAVAAPGYPPYTQPGYGPPGSAFDSTAGLRNYATPNSAPGSLSDPKTLDAAIMAKALGYEGSNQALVNVYHQPLIQIKLRVVEVLRSDNLDVNSVLEYVSRRNAVGSLTSGRSLNGNTVAGAPGFQNQGNRMLIA